MNDYKSAPIKIRTTSVISSLTDPINIVLQTFAAVLAEIELPGMLPVTNEFVSMISTQLQGAMLQTI